MKIEQIYTGCLAQGAYYIQSGNEAVVIDPLREVNPYIQKAQENAAKIKYVLETHFHADFVSGHLTLAEKTGATIVYGPNANPSFDVHIAKDGEILEVGDLRIKVLHTPGHTMESTCYLLQDQTGKDIAIFTGDTLFLGDVGRPDLAQKGADLTQEDLAGYLYDSLRTKIMPLDDDITVYPGHGAGSACGKKMMKVTVDKLGNQKAMNYALRADMSKEEFIHEVTDGLLAPPPYFPLNVQMNKGGYEHIDEVLHRGTRALGVEEFIQIANEEEAIILDVRSAKSFSEGHIPGSIFIGIDGGFAPWVGQLIVDIKQTILFVADEGREEEVVIRLARVGFDQTLGHLKGGITSWKAAGKDIDHLQNIHPTTLAGKMEKEELNIYDVRKIGEYNTRHIADAKLTPLSELNRFVEEYRSLSKPAYIHCAGGYRSVIAASILKARGVHQVINVLEGFRGIKATDIPLSKDMSCSNS